MKSFTDIISQWPSIAELARDLDVLEVTAGKWKSRNRIPVDYWDRLIAAAKKRRIKGVTRNVMHSIINGGNR